jgi:hypothetical protein
MDFSLLNLLPGKHGLLPLCFPVVNHGAANDVAVIENQWENLVLLPKKASATFCGTAWRRRWRNALRS